MILCHDILDSLFYLSDEYDYTLSKLLSSSEYGVGDDLRVLKKVTIFFIVRFLRDFRFLRGGMELSELESHSSICVLSSPNDLDNLCNAAM